MFYQQLTTAPRFEILTTSKQYRLDTPETSGGNRLGQSAKERIQSMNDFESEVSAWCWDGVSIEAIKAHAAQYHMDLRDLVDDHFVGGWPSSVPESYQGFVHGRVDRSEADRTENSLAGHRYYMQILALDQNQRALVMRGVVDLYTDAEGYSVVETSAAEALAWADSYRMQAATCA